jgi:hypothetical protein
MLSVIHDISNYLFLVICIVLVQNCAIITCLIIHAILFIRYNIVQGWQSPSESQAAGMPIAGLKENYVNGKSVRSIVC